MTEPQQPIAGAPAAPATHEPTSRPWAVFWDGMIGPSAHVGRPLGGAVNDTVDRDQYAQQICRVHHDRHGRGDLAANADFIVRAVNSHDALLASLEEILNYRGGADNALDDEYVMQRACEAVRAARCQP